ncbi:MAG TPA: glycosyltransferase [Burkholderiaceae bacterium]
MRIVIDMQGAQSASRGRGIGRYTLSLVEGIVRHRGDHEIILALNGLFEDTIAPIRAHFASMLPARNIRVWHAPGPVHECETQTRARREAAELVREAFLASLRPDVIHVTSLIEGYVDNAVTSIGRFDTHTPVSVSFYDLIPLLYREHYLTPDPLYNDYYLRKLEHMRRADLLLAISESSRREAIELLGCQEAQAVNVSTAADAHFRPLEIGPAEKEALLAKYGISKPFIMYTGATDSRKNVEGLIGAYAMLPENLRNRHQLLIVSHLYGGERGRLQALADARYLLPGDLVLPGFAPDEDLVKLYNLCAVFVMPSWHEGFGLPVLEAMSCGRAAIASDASSLPEVVGRADALFDARSERAIADKIVEALTNDAWRKELEAHGLERAKMFSWDASARRAIAAFEDLHARHGRAQQKAAPAAKKTLAYVSPLPPERTGIANYSVELLPALRKHYDITLIVDQDRLDLPSDLADLPWQGPQWLARHAGSFDRILYQVGNSPFHSHMPELMRRHAGVLVMHDFFNSSMLAADELELRRPHCWSDALYHSHGYPALAVRYHENGGNGVAEAKDRFPCNLSLLQDAAGVIVHSAHSMRLAQEWYGAQADADWAAIPHLRVATPIPDRAAMRRAAREQLGLMQDRFLVCSFGFIAPTKLTHRLLDAWMQSALCGDRECELVLVGENHGGDYGAQLSRRIEQSGARDRIRIAGWTEMRDYELYLQAADIGVQLRSTSRGETSGAVLDCMNHALPTIVNAHGSMADLPEGAVWKLADDFADADLVAALETLRRDEDRRNAFAREARRQITTTHDPAHCAQLYADAIERFHPQAAHGTAALIQRLGEDGIKAESELRRLANAVAASIMPQPRIPQLMIDVSTICKADLQTGIERVVRAQLSALLDRVTPAYRVEPVYLHTEDGAPHYRYARRYTHGLLGIPDIAQDSAVEVTPGDVFYGADFCPADVIKAAEAGIYRHWREAGASVQFLIHDILPVTRPEFFPEGAGDTHAAWLRAIAAEADGLIGISQAVADDTQAWLRANGAPANPAFAVLHHGADLDRSFPSAGLPDDAAQTLQALRGGDSFLMVGTIEPRKGHLQAIEAFEALWRDGSDARLVIVGREGWTALAPAQRRNIPRTMEKLRHHPELGKRLIWMSDISDQYLEQVYQAASCLLFASEAEGFGLPLIEAARHGKPIVVRDIAVFREIAGEHAHYFAGQTPAALAQALKDWIALNDAGKAPASSGLAWNTWRQNADRLLQLLGL